MLCKVKFFFSPFLSGWISSLTGLNKSIPVGIMMIIIAALFTASAVISLVMFKKVSYLFHSSLSMFGVDFVSLLGRATLKVMGMT